ncbi:MAG TPA: transporter substrate-binding domain-containing protein [Bryobacteraceae bacterium]|jgi:polar amino acid transport system substrate-binding protein|nr:transporter substrate-binding domain-containing protein [Bryobacteraceae bacterium]
MRIGVLSALLCAAAAQAQLAPTGTLRAVFLQTNPVQGRVDANTSAITGPAVDLARELGRQLGVPVSVTPVSGPKAVIESLKNRTADIGFLAYDATRATEVDFSHVYAFSWSSYIVPANSPLQVVADVDRKGTRVGSTTGDSPELYLSRNLKKAELKQYGSLRPEEVLRMLAAGEIDAWAANRQRLIEMAAADKSTRVLRDNFFAVQQAIVVAKGDDAALDTVNRFIEAARASGLIKKAIVAAGLGRSVDVAPGKP